MPDDAAPSTAPAADISSVPWVCPFCPLHCDDRTAEDTRREDVCPRSAAHWRHLADGRASTRVGKGGADKSAITHAIDHALAAARPRVVTSGNDLEATRILQRLDAERRIRLSYEESPCGLAFSLAASREGVMAASLGAVRGHADLVWLLGWRRDRAPRLRERLSHPARTARMIETGDGVSADQIATLRFRLSQPDPPERAGPTDGPASDDPELTAWEQAIRGSRYLAIVLGDRAFSGADALVASEMLLGLVAERNGHQRAVILRLDAAATDRAYRAWTTNRPLATRAPADGPSPEPWDVRIGEPTSGDSVPAKIQVGGVDPGPRLAGCYVPAAVPGVHRPGTVIRGDGTVTLPLRACSKSGIPTAAEWLRERLPDFKGAVRK